METDWFYYSLLLLTLFVISFFFSGSEVALFSLSEKQKQDISEKKPRLSKVINQLLKSPKQILITILVGNSLANVGITLTTLKLTLKIADVYQVNLDILLTVQIILLTIVVLLFAEITPKIIASKYPIEFSSVASYPLLWIEKIFSPITFLFNSITNLIQQKIKVDKSKIAINDDEIKALADLGKEHGTLEVDEHNLIHSIVEYGDTTVREIMTARTDMVALNVTESFENTVKKVIETGRSRIPLYQNNLD
ncbi:MAG: CNNM domain-containing protein, partial [Ignavibacteria bacterium]|nr:CNNM domain-containing protein [Ignavibacteria bacterium]